MESPPPTKEKAPFLVTDATAFATSFVPIEKFLNSKTPIGPFQTIVFDLEIIFLNLLTVLGPISKPIRPSGIDLESLIILSSLSTKARELIES